MWKTDSTMSYSSNVSHATGAENWQPLRNENKKTAVGWTSWQSDKLPAIQSIWNSNETSTYQHLNETQVSHAGISNMKMGMENSNGIFRRIEAGGFQHQLNVSASFNHGNNYHELPANEAKPQPEGSPDSGTCMEYEQCIEGAKNFEALKLPLGNDTNEVWSNRARPLSQHAAKQYGIQSSASTHDSLSSSRIQSLSASNESLNDVFDDLNIKNATLGSRISTVDHFLTKDQQIRGRGLVALNECYCELIQIQMMAVKLLESLGMQSAYKLPIIPKDFSEKQILEIIDFGRVQRDLIDTLLNKLHEVTVDPSTIIMADYFRLLLNQQGKNGNIATFGTPLQAQVEKQPLPFLDEIQRSVFEWKNCESLILELLTPCLYTLDHAMPSSQLDKIVILLGQRFKGLVTDTQFYVWCITTEMEHRSKRGSVIKPTDDTIRSNACCQKSNLNTKAKLPENRFPPSRKPRSAPGGRGCGYRKRY